MNEHVDLSLVDQRLAGMERPVTGGPTSGLSRALSERLQIDVVLIRVGFVVLAMFSGIGAALYLWGTALTPRVGGTAPIRRFLPRFGEWGRNTQLGVIGASTLLVALLWSSGNALPTSALLALGVVVWLAVRGKSPATAPTPHPTPEQTAPWPPPQGPPSDPRETLEQWRERMAQAAAMEHLPEVNLYDEPAPSPSPAARRSWLGALLVVAAGVVGTAVPLLIGYVDPAIIAGSGAVASGLALIAWSLLRRSRRIPGLVLAMVLALAIGAAVLGTASVTPMSYSTHHNITADQRDFDYVNVSGAELDLTGHQSGTVSVNVVLSDVTITIPAGASVEITQFGSTVDIPRATGGAGSDLRVEINAVRSTVSGVRS